MRPHRQPIENMEIGAPETEREIVVHPDEEPVPAPIEVPVETPVEEPAGV